MNEITIELPLPDKALSPNGRVHHMAKYRASKTAREVSALTAREALKGTSPPKWERATLQFTFTFNDKRRRDDDNLIAACKAYRDGLEDAGIVADDAGITTLPPVQRVVPKREGRGVMLTVRKQTNDKAPEVLLCNREDE